LLKRRRDPLEQGDGAVGGKDAVGARHLLDLADRLPHALYGRLGPPAECPATEAFLELPWMSLGPGDSGHDPVLTVSVTPR